MLLWSWLLTTSWAAAPTKAPGAFDLADGPVTRLVASLDDVPVVTGITQAGDLVLVDTSGWVAASADLAADAVETCSAASALAIRNPAVGGWFVFVGCTEGTVQTWRWFGDRLVPTGNADTDGFVSPDLGGEVIGLFPDPTDDERMYALVQTGQNVTGIRLKHTSGQVSEDTTYQDVVFLQTGFEEAVPTVEGASVTVSHGGGEFSSWGLGGGAVVTSLVATQPASPRDIATAMLGAYFVDVQSGNGRLGKYTGSADPSAIAILSTEPEEPEALVRLFLDADPAFVVQDAGQIDIYESPGAGDTASYLRSFVVDFTATDMIEGPAGYVLAGASSGDVVVLTALPWVSGLAVSPDAAPAGTEVEVVFEVDEPGSWDVVLDAQRDGSGGVVVVSGDAAAAGRVTTTFVVDDEVSDGDHDLWVRHLASGSPRPGTARASLTVDNPPPSLEIEESGFGPGFVDIVFDRARQDDIVGYDVYISDTEFSAAAYPTGGPEGSLGVKDRVTSPRRVDQPSELGPVTVRIKSLVNGQTYWVAVRAVDATSEGPMSNVVSETPEKTGTICDQVGEPCEGSVCATTPGRGAGGLALLIGAAALRRRRKQLATVGVLSLCLGPATSRAQAPEEPDGPMGVFERDVTPVWSSFEFHYGTFAYQQDAIEEIYGPRAGNVRLEIGLQLYRYAEFDVGIGYLFDRGNTLGVDTGTPSREEARFEWMPIIAQATARIHIIDEQPLVPYGTVGLDWIFWRDTPLDENGVGVSGRRLTGSKFGWHWAAGGNILLDLLAPRRASMLEAITGINDTWLVIEYRRLYVNPGGPGLDLSGWNLSAGLKVDY